MAFDSLTRNVHAILSFFNEKSELVDISRAVTSVSVKQVTCSDDTLKMGEFCQNSLEFEYYQEFLTEKIQWNNKRVKLSFWEGTTEEDKTNTMCDIGIFYVLDKDVSTSNNGKSYKVTAYDLPSVMSEEFDTTKTGNTVAEIVSYITSISGLEFVEGTTFSLENVESVADGTTNVGILAYIVGCDGKNIRTTSDGKLETYWYYSNSDNTHFKGQISRSVQLLGEFTNGTLKEPLNAITSGTDESAISVGSGTALTYTNPYVTKERLEIVLERVKGFDYCVGSVKFRGNPTFRCGDTVQVETSKGEYVLFPIMEQTISFDGGMNATVTSYTYETENTVMGGSPTDKKITQAYSGIVASLQKQTGLINTNLKGGYYRLLQDTDTKYPYGWLIADSEEIASTTKGWRWTQEGLMYSTDGFKTADRFAFTSDGFLSTDMIQANSITTDKLILTFGDTSKMTMQGNSTGVEFVGTGTFTNKSVGNFQLYNYADSSYATVKNRLITFTSDGMPAIDMGNYNSDGVVSNIVREWHDVNSYDNTPTNKIRIANLDNEGKYYVNNITLEHNYKWGDNIHQHTNNIYIQNARYSDASKLSNSFQQLSSTTGWNMFELLNYDEFTGYKANQFYMQSTSSIHQIDIFNRSTNSSTNANNMTMAYNKSSGGTSLTLSNNYDSKNANILQLFANNTGTGTKIQNKKLGGEDGNLINMWTNVNKQCYLKITNSYSYIEMSTGNNIEIAAPNSMTIRSENYNVYLYGKALYWNGTQKW